MEIKGAVPANGLPLEPMGLQNSLKPAAGNADKDRAAVKKVAREFEAMFVGMMMKSMRSTVGKEKLTDGGHGEEMFRSLLDQEYANAAAASGRLGLATMIEKQLSQHPSPVRGVKNEDK
jgi:flagellar protein FlgJ